MLIQLGSGLSPRAHKSYFHPHLLPNLIAHQDIQEFSSLTFASGSGDGDPVATWEDARDNGNNFTRNGSSTHTMIYKEIGALGKPALRKTGPRVVFDGTNTTMYTSAVTQIVFFSVLGTATISTGTIAGLFKSTATLDISGVNLPTYRRQQSAVPATLDAWDDVNDLLMLAVSIADGSNAKLYNGINSLSFDPDAYTSNGGARIGSFSPTTDAPECEYYAHMLFDRALSDAEIAQIYSWGSKKYGVVS